MKTTVCECCAGSGAIPEPFTNDALQLVPCPRCHEAPVFTALCGSEYVESGVDLPELLELLVAHWESAGEDVVVWREGVGCGAAVVAVLRDTPARVPEVLAFAPWRARPC
jgi:hypothetical protein